ncbi:DUF2913 family protein [Enterovibrio norvegicus]|uniref:DUF2913 family protein n=1 Tax=Enterovibrio norvegicus TaxID=188144 RepID=UPI00352E6825
MKTKTKNDCEATYIAFVEASLLHLYLQIASTDRFCPLHKRNSVLSRWCKNALKNKTWQCIRPHIRDLLRVIKRQEPLEARLLAVYSSNTGLLLGSSPYHELQALLGVFEAQLNIYSCLEEEVEKQSDKLLCVIQRESIVNSFAENGAMKAPLDLNVRSDDIDSVIATIQAHSHFSVRVVGNTGNFTSLQLTP